MEPTLMNPICVWQQCVSTWLTLVLEAENALTSDLSSNCSDRGAVKQSVFMQSKRDTMSSHAAGSLNMNVMFCYQNAACLATARTETGCSLE